MKFPPYPKCKPSGVAWLGDVPEHWEVKQLRYVARFAYGDSLAAEDREDGGVPVYGSNGQVGTHVDANTLAPVIVVGRKGSFGKVNFSESAVFAIDTTYFIDRRQTKADLRWLTYLLMSLRLDSISNDSAVPGLAREIAYENFVALPPPAEQQAIAGFLDRETGRLDRLVGRKRELIERLKEKRTALISRTVTRGLPPAAARAAGLPENPPLKPSGLPWLGDIPKHWEVKPVKYVARIGNGSTPNRDNAAYWEEGDYPWLNSSSVNRETITDSEDFVTALALQECHLPKINPPAVLIGITGQGRTRGMASTLLFEATINQHVAYVKPSPEKADVGFLRRVFDMAYEFLRSESDGGGSTKGAITCEQIGTMVIPLPSLPEQAAIAAYLDRETAKLDALVAKVEAAIERLQEYRTALITAAVTGKIDVRKAVPASSTMLGS